MWTLDAKTPPKFEVETEKNEMNGNLNCQQECEEECEKQRGPEKWAYFEYGMKFEFGNWTRISELIVKFNLENKW